MNINKVGDKLWSKYFGGCIEVVSITDDDNWYFKTRHGMVYKAQTKLSAFEKMPREEESK